jgi:hypothetical protein
MPDLPEGCDMRISSTPGISIPALVWKPCVDGRVGCARYTADWNLGARDRTFGSPWRSDPLVVNGQPHFTFVRWYYDGETPKRIVDTLQSLWGAAKYVTAAKVGAPTETQCVNSTGFGDAGLWSLIFHSVGGKTERTWFTSADWSSPFEMRNVPGLSQEWIGGLVTGLFPHQGRLFATMLDNN